MMHVTNFLNVAVHFSGKLKGWIPNIAQSNAEETL